jgi:hypothetical protein
MAYATPVVAATLTNQNISNPGFSTLDGVPLSNPSRILLAGQTVTSQNGVWVWTALHTALARPTTTGDQYVSSNNLDNATLIWVQGNASASGSTLTGTCWGIEPAQTVIVDNITTGLHTLTRVVLPPVQARAATEGASGTVHNVTTYTSYTSIDGVTLTGNGKAGSDIVVVNDQALSGGAGAQYNGLYWANTTSAVMARCSEPLIPGRAVIVGGEGAANAHAQYVIPQQGNVISLGTTGLTFSRQNVHNVMDFGATGNGSTDDTTAINAAFTACLSAGGGAVFFPPGNYMVSGTLNVPNGTIVYGAGVFATTVTKTTPGDVFLTSNPLNSSNICHAHYRDMTVTASLSPTHWKGAWAANTTYSQNDIVRPRRASPRYLQCVTVGGGTSGVSEPFGQMASESAGAAAIVTLTSTTGAPNTNWVRIQIASTTTFNWSYSTNQGGSWTTGANGVSIPSSSGTASPLTAAGVNAYFNSGAGAFQAGAVYVQTASYTTRSNAMQSNPTILLSGAPGTVVLSGTMGGLWIQVNITSSGIVGTSQFTWQQSSNYGATWSTPSTAQNTGSGISLGSTGISVTFNAASSVQFAVGTVYVGTATGDISNNLIDITINATGASPVSFSWSLSGTVVSPGRLPRLARRRRTPRWGTPESLRISAPLPSRAWRPTSGRARLTSRRRSPGPTSRATSSRTIPSPGRWWTREPGSPTCAGRLSTWMRYASVAA